MEAGISTLDTYTSRTMVPPQDCEQSKPPNNKTNKTIKKIIPIKIPRREDNPSVIKSTNATTSVVVTAASMRTTTAAVAEAASVTETAKVGTMTAAVTATASATATTAAVATKTTLTTMKVGSLENLMQQSDECSNSVNSNGSHFTTTAEFVKTLPIFAHEKKLALATPPLPPSRPPPRPSPPPPAALLSLPSLLPLMLPTTTSSSSSLSTTTTLARPKTPAIATATADTESPFASDCSTNSMRNYRANDVNIKSGDRQQNNMKKVYYSLDAYVNANNINLDNISKIIMHSLHLSCKVIVNNAVLMWLGYNIKEDLTKAQNEFENDLLLASVVAEKGYDVSNSNNSHFWRIEANDFEYFVLMYLGDHYREARLKMFNITKIIQEYNLHEISYFNSRCILDEECKNVLNANNAILIAKLKEKELALGYQVEKNRQLANTLIQYENERLHYQNHIAILQYNATNLREDLQSVSATNAATATATATPVAAATATATANAVVAVTAANAVTAAAAVSANSANYNLPMSIPRKPTTMLTRKIVIIFKLMPLDSINIHNARQMWWVLFRQRASLSAAFFRLKNMYICKEIFRKDFLSNKVCFSMFQMIQKECMHLPFKITKNLIENYSSVNFEDGLIINIVKKVITIANKN